MTMMDIPCEQCAIYTEPIETREQLAGARERIVELEQKLDISTAHRISLLPTYPEGSETAEGATECR